MPVAAPSRMHLAGSAKGNGIQHTAISMCCEPDEQMQSALRELQRSRAEVRLIWPVPTRISGGVNILICDYGPGLADMLPWNPGEAEAALVLVLPQNGQFGDDAVVTLAPNAVLQRPVRPDLMRMTVVNAWSQFRYERRLRDRIQRLDENLRAIREVERAKKLLMVEQGVGEEAAYKMLRDMAMQRQVTVAALASAMVSAWTPRSEPMSVLVGRLPDSRIKDR
ncbi:MAG: ANTAR domain-containing response regulator [Devosia sp.]